MNKISISIPSIPEKAEFPVIFLIIFLPAYLNQGSLPAGLFDNPVYHLMTILQSLLILSLLFYLMRKTPPQTGESPSAMAEEIKITHSLITLGGLILLYSLYSFILTMLQRAGYSKPEEAVLLSRGIMLIPSLLTCLAAASMEEFFFRGYAFFRVRQGGSAPVKALIFISLLFAAGHIYEGLPAAFFALISGIFLGLMILRGFSLFSLSAAHGIFNFLMILLSYLKQSELF
ncbi:MULTISPECIES: CPBP family intramembrane glutamic endopeptidase [unclassified Oceanispirochaeta]|uniref:CPBP family intramembrane glutamic endopeptidase n=1 Tax=unclassified Oceanispirochaeta TaxID=2635722 RepID=UPI000E09661F|nr:MULTISPECIES: CPBP family intramembrane glutamic endopeptidase [unclassified Oceanispirochaeta]MBF9015704.1 CPBP family intramembrane metalloprotease [Oceanispirochaeta sp. M2]NPD72169.1 CPBP family intramembrane metalloprotease [Oceanispirochaeta sp. M1]RDG32268.1 CPBP family intramembrane metalloprotease [Oceanispirochaeta sp. M1]